MTAEMALFTPDLTGGYLRYQEYLVTGYSELALNLQAIESSAWQVMSRCLLRCNDHMNKGSSPWRPVRLISSLIANGLFLKSTLDLLLNTFAFIWLPRVPLSPKIPYYVDLMLGEFVMRTPAPAENDVRHAVTLGL